MRLSTLTTAGMRPGASHESHCRGRPPGEGLEACAMDLLAHSGSPNPFTAGSALRLFAESEAEPDSGTRTIVGAVIILGVMGLVIAISLMMSKGKSTS